MDADMMSATMPPSPRAMPMAASHGDILKFEIVSNHKLSMLQAFYFDNGGCIYGKILVFITKSGFVFFGGGHMHP